MFVNRNARSVSTDARGGVLPALRTDIAADDRPDMSTDTTDTRWLTYDEIAAALGITPDSARRLVARKKWSRTAGNDGKARIGVPVERIPTSPLSFLLMTVLMMVLTTPLTSGMPSTP
jgi:hypothetical protein